MSISDKYNYNLRFQLLTTATYNTLHLWESLQRGCERNNTVLSTGICDEYNIKFDSNLLTTSNGFCIEGTSKQLLFRMYTERAGDFHTGNFIRDNENIVLYAKGKNWTLIELSNVIEVCTTYFESFLGQTNVVVGNIQIIL